MQNSKIELDAKSKIDPDAKKDFVQDTTKWIHIIKNN